METVKFTQMKDGDREDYAFLNTHELEYAAGTADRLLNAMVDLDKSISGYKITRLGHSLQAATILRPFVREQCAWVVQTHGDFQMVYYAQHVGGNPNKRDAFKGHAYFDDCAEFCEKWDQNSFDPGYETKPLEFFADMVREVFARKAYSSDVIKKGVRVKLSDSATAAQRKSA